MKYIYIILLVLISGVLKAQTYNPANFTTSNKPYGSAQNFPTDARTYFYDGVNFTWRAYVSTSEVLTYLNLAKYRTGQFDIVINTGGTLSNGVITGGTNAIWYFKDGVTNGDLVLKNAVQSVNGQTGVVVTKNADSLRSLPVDTSLRRNGYALTFDSLNHKWVLAPNGTGSYTAGTGISIAGSVISALPNSAIWNANQIRGRSVTVDDPLPGQGLVWNGLTLVWADTAQGGGGTTFAGNGLTREVDTFKLGGTLTSPVTYVELGDNQLNIGNVSTPGDGQFQVQIGTSTSTQLVLTPGNVQLLYYDGSNSKSIGIGSTPAIVVQDLIDSVGLTYADDYSANGLLNDRWIPDLGTVKNLVGDSIGDFLINGGNNVPPLSAVIMGSVVGTGADVSIIANGRPMININQINGMTVTAGIETNGHIYSSWSRLFALSGSDIPGIPDSLGTMFFNLSTNPNKTGFWGIADASDFHYEQFQMSDTLGNLNAKGTINWKQMQNPPLTGVNGHTYFDSTLLKYRGYLSGGWRNFLTDIDSLNYNNVIVSTRPFIPSSISQLIDDVGLVKFSNIYTYLTDSVTFVTDSILLGPSLSNTPNSFGLDSLNVNPSIVGFLANRQTWALSNTFTDSLFLLKVPTGGSSDSVLVKKADGGIYKIAQSSLGSGTVTSVATNTGTGIIGGTITTTGTIAADTTLLSTRLWRQKGIDSVVALINAVPTLYSANGTLSGNRTVTMSGNTLNFSGGSVGIGATSPANLLNIKTTSGLDQGITIENTGTGATETPAIKLISSGGDFSTLFMSNAASSTPGITGFYTQSSNGFAVLNSGAAQVFNVKQNGYVGISDATPNSLFTVGAGDLFQIDASGMIGMQQAPQSDYLMSIIGTTTNDNSRLIDLVQNNNSGESAFSIYSQNLANFGTITVAGTTSAEGFFQQMTPTATMNTASGNSILNVAGTDNNISLNNLTYGTSAGTQTQGLITGNNVVINGSPTVSDVNTAGQNRLIITAESANISVAPIWSSSTDLFTFTTTGQSINNTASSTGDANWNSTANGFTVTVNGSLTTSGTTAHNGGTISVGADADNNTGLSIDVSGATANVGLAITNPTAASGNYAINSTATAQSYLAGNLGIGVTVPTAYLNLAAGTATASTAPLKFTTGTPTTTPEIGSMQFNSGLWIIDSSNSHRDTIATRSWARNNISGGTTYTFSTGLTNTSSTITNNLSTGVSGGQTAIGGTGSGDNLTLSSTSNGTKGKIILGSASAYDEVNDRLGIGQTTPTAALHLKAGTATASTAPLKFTSGTNLTTAEAGAMEYNGTFYETKASGLRYATGGVIADFTTDANNSGTSATDIYSYITPASTLAAVGDKITFKYTLTLNDITATSQIQVLFAGTAIANTGALTIANTGIITVEGWIIRTGSTTARGSSTISSGVANLTVITGENDLTGLTFTNTNILKITAQSGGAGGGSNDITGKLGTITYWGAANN